jgi:predicted DNA binding protein
MCPVVAFPSVLQLTFRVRRPKAIGSVTAGRAATLHTWCNLETDFVQVLGDDAEAAACLDDILRRFGPDIAFAQGARRAALVPCPANRTTSVSVTVERHSGIIQAPIVSADGWDTFRAILFDDRQARSCLEALAKLGEFELLAKKPLDWFGSTKFFVPSAELLHGLTRRQAEALLAAVESGYYGEPRGTTLGEVAQRFGLSRASLEEHLRKAENKLLLALAPIVAARVASLEPAKPRGVPFAGKRRAKADDGAPRGPARARRA